MSKQAIHTDQAPKAIGPYSQGIVSDGWLFVSGQIALDPQTGQLVALDAAHQAERALENLKAVLQAAGSDLERVVKTTIYLKDIGHFEAVNEVYARFFRPPYPARATVQVSRLPKDALVEIEAIARV